MSDYFADFAVSIRHVSHQPRKKNYKITLEVNEEVGARIMEYAAMVGGLTPWDETKLLDGGLRLTERGEKSRFMERAKTALEKIKSEPLPHLLTREEVCQIFGFDPEDLSVLSQGLPDDPDFQGDRFSPRFVCPGCAKQNRGVRFLWGAQCSCGAAVDWSHRVTGLDWPIGSISPT